MQTQLARSIALDEEADYFPAPGAQLYTVLHRVEQPKARLLLVGPLPSERHYAYVPWVTWARFLAQRGIEVLRYDHRGVGESEGVFAESSFPDWCRDVLILARWFGNTAPQVPLVLHGLEIGALLAAHAFAAGAGDLLLLWAAPESANQALRSALLRWVALEQISRIGTDPKRASAVIRALEAGESYEVAGYRWSSRLWLDSLGLRLPPQPLDPRRPKRSVPLGKQAAPLVKSGYMPDEERKDFSALFVENWEWLAAMLTAQRGGTP